MDVSEAVKKVDVLEEVVRRAEVLEAEEVQVR